MRSAPLSPPRAPPAWTDLVMKTRHDSFAPPVPQHPSQHSPLQQTDVVLSLPPQTVRSGAVEMVQEPVAGSHVLTSHGLAGAEQTTGLLPTQTPFWQVSV